MIRTDWSLCGCGGKPDFDRRIHPALEKVETSLDHVNINVSESVDAGKIPRSAELGRSTQFTSPSEISEIASAERTGQWALAGTLTDRQLGTSSEEFGDFLVDQYRRATSDTPGDIVKGHTVQIKGSSDPVHFFEWFNRQGGSRNGYWVVNLDIIHALPTFSPVEQARVAMLNSLNDCYTLGAHINRGVRPYCFYPHQQEITEREVGEWFERGSPEGISVSEPVVIPYRGEDWLFGASVVSEVDYEPASNVSDITPGDQILIHQPLGCLALLRYSLMEELAVDCTERIRRDLLRDHLDVARVLADFYPDYESEPDSSRHVKFASDVSGGGIRGINRILGMADTHLRLEDLPLVDRDIIERAQAQWALPDVTVETNGPIVMIGEPSVIEQLSDELDKIGTNNPRLLGSVAPGKGTIESQLDLGIYVEYIVSDAD